MKLIPITQSIMLRIRHLLAARFEHTDRDMSCFIFRISEPRMTDLLKKLKKENPSLFEYKIHPNRFIAKDLLDYIVVNKMQDFMQRKYMSLIKEDWYQPTQETLDRCTY